jgi:hypothetical protein
MIYYRSIKELVIETYMAEGGFPSYEKLTSLVRQHFPTASGKKLIMIGTNPRLGQGEFKFLVSQPKKARRAMAMK